MTYGGVEVVDYVSVNSYPVVVVLISDSFAGCAHNQKILFFNILFHWVQPQYGQYYISNFIKIVTSDH